MASLEIQTLMPRARAAAPVCSPIQRARSFSKSSSGNRAANPRTVEALVKVSQVISPEMIWDFMVSKMEAGTADDCSGCQTVS